MELGQRIRWLRQELGLSQRQLCGDMITRNMLSQIENGSARPSMDTLRYLAGKLNKPVSWFLEEDTITSPNQAVMEQAREAYYRKEYNRAAEILEDYRKPDTTFDWEKNLLYSLVCLARAEQALADKRLPFARHLLEEAIQESPYCTLLEGKRSMLLARIDLNAPVPDVDDVLLQKAEHSLGQADVVRAAALLEAAEDHGADRWIYLQGEISFARGEYRQAAAYFTKVEEVFSKAVIPKLEECFSQLEDYKMAYYYACKQKK